MAILRRVSRIVVFSRSAKIGRMGGTWGRAALLVAIGVCASGGNAVQAQTVSLPVYDPTTNDNLVGATIVSGGANKTLVGAATQIHSGIIGFSLVPLPTLFASGAIIAGSQYADPNNAASLVVNTGSTSKVISVPDPITGGTQTVSVYNNSNIFDTHANSIALAYTAGVNTPANNQQYINARLGTVDSTGGTLNVRIGTTGAAPTAASNNINMVTKQTDLFYADGTGSAASIVNWTSQNQVNLGNVGSSANTANGSTSSVSNTFSTYTGTFTAFDGSTHTVTSAADLRAYNNFLIAQMTAGNLNPAQYRAQFGKAYSSSAKLITYTIYTGPAGDEAQDPIGQRSVIHAVGPNATGQVAAGGAMDLNAVSEDTRPNAVSGVGAGLLADQGANIFNNGRISVLRIYNDNGAGMYARGGSTATNNGLININFQTAANPAAQGLNSLNTAIVATGAGTTISNAGVINLTGPGSTGTLIQQGAQGANSGVINVGVYDMSTSIYKVGTTIYGANVQGGSFTNTGTIYLGRGPQGTVGGAAGADTSNTSTPLIGIAVAGGSAAATNAGTITIGTKTQGSTAISATGGAGAVVNSGNININGAASAVPAMNIGIDAQNSTSVTNSGSITLNGVNGIGLRVLSSGAAAAATTSGTINVAGGADPASGARNYGVWSEGTQATATVNGAVNLTGIGAIGAHARNGGTIDIGTSGAVNFVSGSTQIGFYANGDGSKINNAATSLDVSTQNSTLFLMAGGADFAGSTSNLTGSGQGSTVVRIRDAGSDLQSGAMTVNLTGQNATGFHIEGGATGTIASTSNINMLGVGTVAGIVDGQNHDLTGAAVGAPVATTTLTNQSDVAGAGANTTAFIAQNQGQLINQGTISLTGTNDTGIHALSGATVQNDGDTAVTNGTAILAENAGPGPTTTITTTGPITVTDGTGIIDRDGAALSNSGAITVTDGTGVLLENTTTGNVTAFTNIGAITVDDGIAGVQVRNGAALDGSNLAGTITTGGTAHGVLIDNGTVDATLGATTIDVNGTGNGLENAAEFAGIGLTGTTINMKGSGAGIRTNASTVTASTATINAEGVGSTGYLFQNADGSATANNLNIGAGYLIDATGAGANGLVINTTGTALTGATIAVDADGGSAIVVKSSRKTLNSGTLTSASAAPVVDLSPSGGTIFDNTGTIQAAVPQNIAIRGSAGSDTINLGGDLVTGIINAGAGDDIVNWDAVKLVGSIEMGAGNDTLTISDKTASDLAAVYHLDGGAGDGDVLNLDGIQYKGGSFAADDLAKGINLMAGWDTINLENHANWELTGNLTLDDPAVNIDTTSTLQAGNGVMPVISAAATPVTVNNAGLIDLTNGVSGPGDRLTIIGNYVGQGGTIRLNTSLGDDNSPSDRLMIDGSHGGGSATGSTTLEIINAGGLGALTMADGIKVVDAINGATTSPTAFHLGGAVAAGAWDYSLFYGGVGADANDQDWYLRSVALNTVAQTAQPYADVLGTYAFSTLGTLQQRTGNRIWPNGDPPETILCRDPVQNDGCTDNATPWDDQVIYGAGAWSRIGGRYSSYDPKVGSSYSQGIGFMQAGYEGTVLGTAAGELTFGPYATTGTSIARIEMTPDPVTGAARGDGKITTSGYGIGANLTWLGSNGFYADAIGQFMWYDSSLSNKLHGNNQGWSSVLSLEAGQRLEFGDGWAAVPQAQLAWTHVDYNSYIDTLDDRVSLRAGDSLKGRAGMRVEKLARWKGDDGQMRRLQMYGIVNLNYEFLGGTKVDVAGISIRQQNNKLWGEVGLGANYQWNDKWSVFGEGDFVTALGGHGGKDNYMVKGNVGLRYKF